MRRRRISGGAFWARQAGRPICYEGLVKVLLGLTTIEEIEAQTPVEIAEADGD
jgi:hypothetical protein